VPTSIITGVTEETKHADVDFNKPGECINKIKEIFNQQTKNGTEVPDWIKNGKYGDIA